MAPALPTSPASSYSPTPLPMVATPTFQLQGHLSVLPSCYISSHPGAFAHAVLCLKHSSVPSFLPLLQISAQPDQSRARSPNILSPSIMYGDFHAILHSLIKIKINSCLPCELLGGSKDVV